MAPPNRVDSNPAPAPAAAPPSADLNELVDTSTSAEELSTGANGRSSPRIEDDSIHVDPTSLSKVAASSTTATATTTNDETPHTNDATDSALLAGVLPSEPAPQSNGSALESRPTPAPAEGVDKLSSQTAALSLTSDKPATDVTGPSERPRTPSKPTPAVVGVQEVTSPPPPPPPPKDVPPKDIPPKLNLSKDSLNDSSTDRLYLDPPLTPVPSRPSSPIPSPTAESAPRKSLNRSEHTSEDEATDNTRSEIHDLFEKSHRASITEEMLQRPSPLIPSTPTLSSSSLAAQNRHPPRSSSLSTEASGKPAISPIQTTVGSPQLPEGAMFSPSTSTEPQSASTPVTAHRPPPPDEDLPFDFHRFLSQLRHRSADPVAKFLRSFLSEFAKKQWMVHEQVKIVQDFLNFIYGKMENCEVWRDVGEVEMDNAREGMEKLVMNRLYTQTFSPAIPPQDHSGRKLDDKFPGRGGQHQEDVERDEVLTQKVRIYSWIREEHLDIGDTISGEGGRRFLDLAVKEMLKIGSYRAPRDKVICVLNCCKVIFGLLRHSRSEESADKFVPLLIYVVLRANPPHLVSNVQYILRFRNPDKLNGEAGYYLSSLMGAIQFVENLDRSSLTITPEEFEANVEAAVAAIAERPPPPSPQQEYTEKPRRSMERNPRISTSSRESGDPASDGAEEKNAVTGLLKTIQKPLSSIGRMFSDDPSTSAGSASTPQPGTTPRHSPPLADDPVLTALGGRRGAKPTSRERQRLSAEEAAARQASAEAEEAARIGQLEYENVVEILKGMFPALDKDVIGDVVRVKEGRVGLAVDACLALSAS